jgi:predicted MFS family arabinose efflux permease
MKDGAGRGVQLVLLACAMAAAGYARTAISPLQEAMRVALALSDNEMALLQGPVVGIPVALAAIPLGLLIDQRSRTQLLRVLIVLSLVGSLLTAVTSSFPLLLVARGLAGLTGLAILPVVFSFLADLYPPTQRGRVTTVALVGQVSGNSAAFWLGGALLALSGPDPSGWRESMLWMSAPLVVMLLLSAFLREPARTGRALSHSSANPSVRQVWHELRHHRGVVIVIVLAIMLVEIAIGGMLVWGAPMLSRAYALAPDRVGAIMAMGMMVSGILGPILGGALADLCQRSGGPRRTVSVLVWMAVASVPTSLFAFVPGVASASVLLVASMTLMLAIVTMGMAVFTIVIPNELRGLCMSVLIAACVLAGLAIAPPAVSLLSGAVAGLEMIGHALSVVCAASGLGAAVIFALGRSYVPREAVP